MIADNNALPDNSETSTRSVDVEPVVMCRCPVCGAPKPQGKDHSWANGLSVRAANALILGGIKSKSEVKELMKVRFGLRRIYKIGPTLEEEIINWINT